MIGAGCAALGAADAVFAVKIEPSGGRYRHRFLTYPPIDQVEMMGRLVHQQAAAVFEVTVPAAVLIGAVGAVELPTQIDVVDIPQRPRPDEFFDAHHLGHEAAVEGDLNMLSGLLFRFQNASALGDVGGHRLFGDYVAAGVQRADDVVIVRAIDRGDDDGIWPDGAEHIVKVVKHRQTAAFLAEIIGAAGVGIVKPGDPHPIDKLRLGQRSAEHHQRPSAGAHNAIFLLQMTLPHSSIVTATG